MATCEQQTLRRTCIFAAYTRRRRRCSCGQWQRNWESLSSQKTARSRQPTERLDSEGGADVILVVVVFAAAGLRLLLMVAVRW